MWSNQELFNYTVKYMKDLGDDWKSIMEREWASWNADGTQKCVLASLCNQYELNKFKSTFTNEWNYVYNEVTERSLESPLELAIMEMFDRELCFNESIELRLRSIAKAFSLDYKEESLYKIREYEVL